jgi:hypothetical protein
MSTSYVVNLFDPKLQQVDNWIKRANASIRPNHTQPAGIWEVVVRREK